LTTDLAKLFQFGAPTFYIATMDDYDADSLYVELVRAAGDGEVVRRIRGPKCRDREGFFSEVGAALQVPSYFGENWDALEDVLNDMAWLPGRSYLLLVSAAHELLADAGDDQLRTFAAILNDLRSQSEELEDEEYRSTWHVLSQCPAEEAQVLQQRLREAGAEFELA
jgi:RNAse (barnase) inhibitor barstar